MGFTWFIAPFDSMYTLGKRKKPAESRFFYLTLVKTRVNKRLDFFRWNVGEYQLDSSILQSTQCIVVSSNRSRFSESRGADSSLSHPSQNQLGFQSISTIK